MTRLKICRICLTKDEKMYNIGEYQLKLYYEEIMSQKVIIGLPRYFCYTCAAMLYKFHKFKEKSLLGQRMLQELLLEGPITLDSISQVDRKSKNLQSTLEIITDTERVKTYNVVHNSPDLVVKEDTKGHTEIDNSETEDVDDNSSEYNNEDTNIDEEMVSVDEEEIVDKEKTDSEFEDINLARQTVFNDHTYLSENTENKPNLKRKTVHVPHVVKKSENSENSIVLVVGDSLKLNSDDDSISKDTMIPKTNNILEMKTVIINRPKNIVSEDKKNKQHTSKDNQANKNQFKLPKPLQLDPKYWIIVHMNEAEAIEDFKSRANDPKYLRAVYKCDKCYSYFSTEEIMNKHMKLIHCESRGPHECPFCRKRFRVRCKVTQHVQVHYTKFKCLKCNLVFHMEHAATNHNELHIGLLRKCKHCDLEFRHRTTYYSHLRIYHRSEHVCSTCGASFVSEKGLQQHKNLTHFNTEIENTDKEEFENTYCERCDIKFETVKAYDTHFNESDKHADEQTGDINKKKVPNTAPLKAEAAKSFYSRVKIPRVTTCFVCGQQFPSYARYVRHHRAEHTEVPVHTLMCEICGVTVKSSTIATHMNIHTRERIYSCDTCGAEFCHSTSLIRHQMTHTGERPFKCPLCDKRFTQKVSMQIHHRTVHLKEPYPKRAKRRRKTDVDQVKQFVFSDDSDAA